MSVKIFDTMTTATPNFPLAYAEKINVKLQDGTEDNLQNLFDNGELGGGGGDSSVTITQQEYEALSEEQKLDGLYYTYDTKRIYKNGVQYGASDAEGIGYNNAESGIQATTVQGAIDKVVKTVEDNYAKTTDIPTTLPANGGNADTVNNHTVKSDVPENAVFTDTVYDDTELNAKLNGKADKNYVDNNVGVREMVGRQFLTNADGMITVDLGFTADRKMIALIFPTSDTSVCQAVGSIEKGQSSFSVYIFTNDGLIKNYDFWAKILLFNVIN